ncbi:delta-lactam-biosynthetic de-N-acetylase [Schinkia sp. CFF1]
MKGTMKTILCMITTFLLFLSSTMPIVVAETVPNTPIHWGMKKSRNEQPAEAGAMLESVLEKYGSFYLGDTSKKDIYLTFDNGYENGFTSDILDVLKKKKVPATFFVTGHYITENADLVKRMVDEGHIVGNHSWHHPDLTQVSDIRFKKELVLIKEEYKKLTGKSDMMYLRPPRGIFSERTLQLSKELGYVNVFWSLAFVDWHINNQKGWKYAYDNIVNQIHPGAVILLHTVSEDNAKALSKVIDTVREKGYTFKSLDDLMLEKAMPKPLLYQNYIE